MLLSDSHLRWACQGVYLVVQAVFGWTACDIYLQGSDMEVNSLPFHVLLANAAAWGLLAVLQHDFLSLEINAVAGLVACVSLGLLWWCSVHVFLWRHWALLLLAVASFGALFILEQTEILQDAAFIVSLLLIASPLLSLETALVDQTDLLLPWYQTTALGVFAAINGLYCLAHGQVLGLCAYAAGVLVVAQQARMIARPDPVRIQRQATIDLVELGERRGLQLLPPRASAPQREGEGERLPLKTTSFMTYV